MAQKIQRTAMLVSKTLETFGVGESLDFSNFEVKEASMRVHCNNQKKVGKTFAVNASENPDIYRVTRIS